LGYHSLHFNLIINYRLKISRLPTFKEALTIPSKKQGAILLDIGCCFGNDIRKAVDDGWPVQDTIAADLQQGFWDYGHELFKSTPESFPASFIAGDAFKLITPRDPFYDEPDTLRPVLKSLTSLTPLQGHVSAIHASSFFHLFGEAKQLELARLLATLLSPAPGSVIFGSHGGSPGKEFRSEISSYGIVEMFCHSAESWKEVWDGVVFKKGTVRVDTWIKEVERPGMWGKYFLLVWGVTRL